MFILLVKKEFPSLSCAKHIYVEVNSIFLVPTTTTTPTTSPMGKQYWIRLNFVRSATFN